MGCGTADGFDALVDADQLIDGAVHDGRIAERDAALRQIAGDHGAGSHQRPGTDADERQDGHVDADVRTGPDRRSGHHLL